MALKTILRYSHCHRESSYITCLNYFPKWFILPLKLLIVLKHEYTLPLFFMITKTISIIWWSLASCVSKASQCHRKTQIECNLLRSQQSILNHHYKCIEGRPTFQECNRKYVVKAAHAIPSFDSESHASSPKNILDPVKKFLVALYWFCNPHSMIGRVSSNFSSIHK